MTIAVKTIATLIDAEATSAETIVVNPIVFSPVTTVISPVTTATKVVTTVMGAAMAATRVTRDVPTETVVGTTVDAIAGTATGAAPTVFTMYSPKEAMLTTPIARPTLITPEHPRKRLRAGLAVRWDLLLNQIRHLRADEPTHAVARPVSRAMRCSDT